jgi:hypothetical protein
MQKELTVDSQVTENDYQLQYGARSRLRPMICVLVTNCAKTGPKHANAQPLTRIV